MRRLQRFALGPSGAWMIRFMGHMAPGNELRVERPGLAMPSPVMLSSTIDPEGRAARAFGEMEIGAIEVNGPDFERPRHAAVVQRFDHDVPLRSNVARAAFEDVDAAMGAGATFVFVEDQVVDGCGLLIEGQANDVQTKVEEVRAQHPTQLIAAGGDFVREPADAVALRTAGADIVVIGEGFAAAGPGLPKRINEALVAMHATARPDRLARNWIAGALFSLGLLFASCVAIYVAFTSVILPYDEQYLGTDMHGLHRINALLPDFMAHDRLSYAGATISVALFYLSLAVFGIRRRLAWAFHTFVVAGIVGFATFLLYFGFGYFDRGNALVVAILLPFFLAAVIKPPRFRPYGSARDLVNDRIWRRALWGQLCFVVLAIGLIVGGAVICVVGSTNVFVISDLEYLGTTSAALQSAHQDLLPLVAHDRASFGGAILANGVAVLFIALWGMRRGERWVWWTIALAGAINLGLTLYAHFSTGYDELGHLLPVFFAAALFVLGLVLTASYLLARVEDAVNQSH